MLPAVTWRNRYRYTRIKNARELSNRISSNEEIYKFQNIRNILTCLDKNWSDRFLEILNQSQNFGIFCVDSWDLYCCHRLKFTRIKNARELSNRILSNEKIYKFQNTRNFLTCLDKNWQDRFLEILNQSQNFGISCVDSWDLYCCHRLKFTSIWYPSQLSDCWRKSRKSSIIIMIIQQKYSILDFF